MRTFARTCELSLLLSVTVLLACSAQAQQTELEPRDLVATYTQGGRFGGSAITIELRGRYHIDSSDCTQEFYEAGTYTFKAGVISFVTTKRTVKGHGGSDEQARDLLDPKVYKEQYQREPSADNRRSELIPVKWGERLYLMHKDSTAEFCNAINLGLEPRQSLGAEWYFGTFYLRNGDEDKPADGQPSLSNDLIALLLEKRVEAEIINIEGEGETEVAVINKGSEAGLKPGMRLVLTEPRFWDGPSLWSGLVVISATYNLAKLKIFEEVKIGDKVSTKFVDRRFK